MRAMLRIVSAVLILATTGALASAQEKSAAPVTPSLYDRLGGLYPISAVVDDLVDRIYVNKTLNANPNVAKARTEVRKPGLKVNLANMVCMATGGPCKYTGQGMKDSHASMHITQKEWDALLVDFRADATVTWTRRRPCSA